MPKEQVFSRFRPYTDKSSAQSVVGVHWGIEQEYVQVSASLFNDDGVEVRGDMSVTQAEGEAAERRRVWSEGFYIDLDRAGINNLIRYLRRARDQSFGRDE